MNMVLIVDEGYQHIIVQISTSKLLILVANFLDVMSSLTICTKYLIKNAHNLPFHKKMFKPSIFNTHGFQTKKLIVILWLLFA